MITVPEDDFDFELQDDGSYRVTLLKLDWYVGTIRLAYRYWLTEPPTGPHATQLEAAWALVNRVSSKRRRQTTGR